MKEGVEALNGKFPLCAGLYLPGFANNAKLWQGSKNALRNGTAGISLFGDVSDTALGAPKTAPATVRS